MFVLCRSWIKTINAMRQRWIVSWSMYASLGLNELTRFVVIIVSQHYFPKMASDWLAVVVAMALLPVKLRVAHAPGMPEMFPPSPLFSDPHMHHGTCVTHAPWCMPGLLTTGFLWSRWQGKRSCYSRRNTQFYVYGKRHILWKLKISTNFVTMSHIYG